MQDALQAQSFRANTTEIPPQIICPVIRAIVQEEKLKLDAKDGASVFQLRSLLRHLSMPPASSWLGVLVALFLSNRLIDIARNLFQRRFYPKDMHRGLIKHSCSTTILSADGPGIFSEVRFREMADHSADGKRMTEADFLRYNEKLQKEPGSTSVGASLNRLEFSLLLDFLGEIDEDGNKFLSINDLRSLYQDGELPSHKKTVITGRAIRREPGSEQPVAGLRVELWHERPFRNVLLASDEITSSAGEFALSAVLPPNGLSANLKFIDPRPSMEGDQVFFEYRQLGIISEDLELGPVDVPHWQYDKELPFPAAKVNPQNDRIPQRFVKAMRWAFMTQVISQETRLFLVRILSRMISRSAAHDFFPSMSGHEELQAEDSDEYFMYRVLNGFNPSPVYLKPKSDPAFPDAKYFLDCDFDGYQSDGSHNLISAKLYFNVDASSSDPIPCGIQLRIRDSADTQPWTKPEVVKSIARHDGEEWALAKRAFRSAWATAGELDAHLGAGHLNVAQYAISAYRNFFSSPVRQLLLPFLRGVTQINHLGGTSIIGEKGVLSTNTPLTMSAIEARLHNHLGTLNWYNWAPPQRLYEGHIYPEAANLFWDVVEKLVNQHFEEHREEIEKHMEEVHQFSIDLVNNCVPFVEQNRYEVASQTARELNNFSRKRSTGLKETQLSYQKHKGVRSFITETQTDDHQDRELSIHKIEDIDDIRHCCKYIIFHATFWHWWTNDLQATDMSNAFYTCLGLKNGALCPGEDALPSVNEIAKQLSFAELLTSVHVGRIMDQDQPEVVENLAALLEEERSSFAALQNRFEPDSTFDVSNIRSRINI